ncbi:MAG: hypothetical protein HEQ35_06095 [Gloeotrichia echinulata IR180]
MSTNEELKSNQKQEYCQPLLVKHGLLTDVTHKSGEKGKDTKEGKEGKEIEQKPAPLKEGKDKEATKEMTEKQENEAKRSKEQTKELPDKNNNEKLNDFVIPL